MDPCIDGVVGIKYYRDIAWKHVYHIRGLYSMAREGGVQRGECVSQTKYRKTAVSLSTRLHL
jgi:hypothetical protein